MENANIHRCLENQGGDFLSKRQLSPSLKAVLQILLQKREMWSEKDIEKHTTQERRKTEDAPSDIAHVLRFNYAQNWQMSILSIIC